MRSLLNILSGTILLGLVACTGTSNPKSATTDKKPVLNALVLDERLKEADSLVLVFYKDPYTADSLRYTRYYTQASVVTGDLDPFLLQMSENSQQEELRKCRSEGKIWCFSKGKVFQTIYYSTRCSDCCFTYLIKDGNFYYSAISPSFVGWLETWRKKAVELPNQGEEKQ